MGNYKVNRNLKLLPIAFIFTMIENEAVLASDYLENNLLPISQKVEKTPDISLIQVGPSDKVVATLFPPEYIYT